MVQQIEDVTGGDGRCGESGAQLLERRYSLGRGRDTAFGREPQVISGPPGDIFEEPGIHQSRVEWRGRIILFHALKSGTIRGSVESVTIVQNTAGRFS